MAERKPRKPIDWRKAAKPAKGQPAPKPSPEEATPAERKALNEKIAPPAAEPTPAEIAEAELAAMEPMPGALDPFPEGEAEVIAETSDTPIQKLARGRGRVVGFRFNGKAFRDGSKGPNVGAMPDADTSVPEPAQAPESTESVDLTPPAPTTRRQVPRVKPVRTGRADVPDVVPAAAVESDVSPEADATPPTMDATPMEVGDAAEAVPAAPATRVKPAARTSRGRVPVVRPSTSAEPDAASAERDATPALDAAPPDDMPPAATTEPAAMPRVKPAASRPSRLPKVENATADATDVPEVEPTTSTEPQPLPAIEPSAAESTPVAEAPAPLTVPTQGVPLADFRERQERERAIRERRPIGIKSQQPDELRAETEQRLRDGNQLAPDQTVEQHQADAAQTRHEEALRTPKPPRAGREPALRTPAAAKPPQEPPPDDRREAAIDRANERGLQLRDTGALELPGTKRLREKREKLAREDVADAAKFAQSMKLPVSAEQLAEVAQEAGTDTRKRRSKLKRVLNQAYDRQYPNGGPIEQQQAQEKDEQAGERGTDGAPEWAKQLESKVDAVLALVQAGLPVKF